VNLIIKRKLSQKIKKGESRVSENSFLYRKVVPAILIGLVFVAVVLILVAAGILIGFIPYQ
jgi:hypothetical protein